MYYTSINKLLMKLTALHKILRKVYIKRCIISTVTTEVQMYVLKITNILCCVQFDEYFNQNIYVIL